MRQRVMADGIRPGQVAAIMALRDLAEREDLPVASWAIDSWRSEDAATPTLNGFVNRPGDEEAAREAIEVWAARFGVEVTVRRPQTHGGPTTLMVSFMHGVVPVAIAASVQGRAR
ncbi:hypothetical protein [Actinomadura violacea]|uniref:Uncharacterized protein n=1 Tax=Actinomadura violacea TaxID=2819934 RepID=A0ABS3RRI2_9ACTN|nr:hypothetical protein [Actinomadura violacea]MBO2459361.1 hypothetical protein [Actinomadura violacea]